MCKDFLADPEQWYQEQEDHTNFASIISAEQMWEVVRFFEFHGISFEPETDESWEQSEQEWQEFRRNNPEMFYNLGIPHVPTPQLQPTGFPNE